MRRSAAIAFAVFLASCSRPQQPAPEAKKAPPEYFHVDPATAGTLSGKAVFHGAVPRPTLINMEEDAGCAKLHAGRPVPDQPVLVSKAGGLANVFIYVKTGLEGKTFEPPAEQVILDQRGCLYVPRVFGIRAGQVLDVKNSDPVSHNVHPRPTNNYDWNQQQGPGDPDLQHKFPRPDVMIPVRCNVHNWMRSYIGVLAHPYFAVTAADGSFAIPNLPPGQYTIAAWHEKLGEQTQPVSIGPSEKGSLEFLFR
jgi:Polysaccharide lyase family 4, domain II